MALLLDALGQNHSLRRGLCLGTAKSAFPVSAGTLEGAALETSAIGIKEASHALAEALGLRTMAHVLACRPVAAEVGSAEEGLRHGALRGDALGHGHGERGVRLLHAGQEAGLIAAGALERTGLRGRTIGVGQARVHTGGAVAHGTLAFLLACSCAAIHGVPARSQHVGQALALNTFHQWRCECRGSLSHTIQQAVLIPAWALEGTVLVTRTSRVTHAVIDRRLALGYRASASVGAT